MAGCSGYGEHRAIAVREKGGSVVTSDSIGRRSSIITCLVLNASGILAVAGDILIGGSI
jgi:hypothetical protein